MKNPVPGSKTAANGSIGGYSLRFNMGWRFYGETQYYPGLMLGLEKEQGALSYGVFGEAEVFSQDGEASVEALHQYIDDYDRRENPKGNARRQP